MLLERDAQLEVLAERLAAAEAGSGSVLLVAGEAGAGKTSLVAEFATPLASRAVIGACDPLSTPAPLGPLRDFVDAETLAEGASVGLFARVLERFGRTSSAGVMVLEDLHWADQATLDFVRYVGRRVADHRLMVVCTYRNDEIGVDHPLQVVLGQLARLPTTVRISVPRLTVDAVRTLTGSTDLDSAAVHQLTGGNAFFVSEIIAGAGRPPESLRDAVLARLTDLPPSVRRVIETVSISPRSLDLERTLALGNNSGDVDRAVAGGVIQADGTQLRFRHDLARTVVKDSTPPARRHELHRSMIDLLLEEDDRDHARLAHHAIEARDPALIAAHAPVAAQDAQARGAGREAVALYRAALEHAEELEPGHAAALRFELGDRLTGMDDPTAGLEQIGLALQQFTDGGMILRQCEGWRFTGRALTALGRVEEARQAYWRAVELAETQGPSEQLVLALSNVASEAMLARRPSAGLPYADRAVEMADQLGLGFARHSVEHTKACLVLISGDEDRGLDLLRQSAMEAGRFGADRHVQALVNLGSGAGEVRRYATAIDALVEAESLGTENDIDSAVAYTRAWLARVAFEQGRWDDAVAYAELVDRTTTNRSGYALLTALGALGRSRVRRGDPGGATALEQTLEGSSEHHLQYRWSPVSGLAEHYWLRGDTDAMVALLTGPYEEALESGSRWARGELGYWMWKAGAIEDPPAGAARPYEIQIGGDPQRAAELWEQMGCPYEAALARTEAGADAAVEALPTLVSLGAAPLADRVRADLRAAGVDRIPRGPSRSTTAHPFGLTGRQAEVLALIVEGLSNGEIADRLYVSKKTVEHHVSAVYAKLGVETRAQAIAVTR